MKACFYLHLKGLNQLISEKSFSRWEKSGEENQCESRLFCIPGLELSAEISVNQRPEEQAAGKGRFDV